MSITFTNNAAEIAAAIRAAAKRAEQVTADDGVKFIQQTAPRLTGRFAESIQDVYARELPESEGGGYAITNSKRGFWGMYLEFGTVKMPPQPTFGPMMEVMGPKLEENVAEELRKIIG